MLLTNIAIFVPPKNGPLPPPGDRPIVRATKRLLNEQIQCIFGHEFRRTDTSLLMDGLCAYGQQWIKHSDVEIHAVYDRFPSQLRRQSFQPMLKAILPSPMGNPYPYTLLCRDKIKTQHWLESNGIRMPELVTQYDQFEAKLAQWGTGFIKPQFGALGTSVEKVYAGGPLPRHLPGLVPNEPEPTILQRAIHPPKGHAGMSVRCLIQRQTDTQWICRTPVLRHSTKDPVVNVARGASACTAEELLPEKCMLEIKHTAMHIGELINTLECGRYALECGIDYVIDSEYRPWIVELNSRPRGRLEYLAQAKPDQYGEEHIEALAQPIRCLATLASG